MLLSLPIAIGLLLIASLVAMAARRLHFPYAIGLVIAGFALALGPAKLDIELTRELVFSVLLPPLIFEATLAIPWKEFRRYLGSIAWLASVGIIIAAALTAWLTYFFFHWPPPIALAFGALIAATDPVSVIATFRECRVSGPVAMHVEGESLLNDAVATILFGLAIAWWHGSSPTPASIGLDVLVMLGGGLLIGAFFGAVTLFLARRTADHLIEITLTMVAAYGSFLCADFFHSSGVVATIVAGFMIGSWKDSGTFSAKGQTFLDDYWEYIAFVINSMLFLLVGLAEAQQGLFAQWRFGLMVFVIVFIARATSIYSACIFLWPSSWRVPFSEQHVLVWAGLRGALSLALAESLPRSMPFRHDVIIATFFVVGASLIVQGLSMGRILTLTGFRKTDTSTERSPDE
jgi:CPA1 family monovalent cation:H+ antiporter